MLLKHSAVLLAGALIMASLVDEPGNAAGNGLSQSASGVEAFIGVVPAERPYEPDIVFWDHVGPWPVLLAAL